MTCLQLGTGQLAVSALHWSFVMNAQLISVACVHYVPTDEHCLHLRGKKKWHLGAIHTQKEHELAVKDAQPAHRVGGLMANILPLGTKLKKKLQKLRRHAQHIPGPKSNM